MRTKVFLAVAIFAILLGCSQRPNEGPVAGAKPFEVKCSEPVPEFTLGEKSNPSAAKVAELCSCVWKSLQGWERETSIKIKAGKESEVSALNMRAFPARFGDRLKECGAMSL